MLLTAINKRLPLGRHITEGFDLRPVRRPPFYAELHDSYLLLYEKRRDLIQVTGRVLLDDNGLPKQIIDVTDIRDLDLSALSIDMINHGVVTLKALDNLSYEPVLDETKQLQCIEHPKLGIYVYAPTRGALLAELQEQIGMLWVEYARARDDELDAPARMLKKELLSRFGEVRDAS
jgi:hypothetical protein